MSVSTRVLESLIDEFYVKKIQRSSYGTIHGVENFIHQGGMYRNHYDLQKWRLVYTNIYEDNNDHIVFKFRNDSSGWYIARPWRVKTDNGKFEYKVEPQSKIQVGSIPAMMLQSRTVTPQPLEDRYLEEVKVTPLGKARQRPENVNKSYIEQIKKRYPNLSTINLNGKRVKKARLNYDELRDRFLDFATEQCVRYISMYRGREYRIV